MSNNIFGERLRSLRTSNNMTQNELAKKLGISASSVGMYEQGRRQPDNRLLSSICSVFNSSTDFLLGLTGSDISSNREIDDMIDEFTRILTMQQGLMFNGEPVSAEDREKIVSAIRVAAAVAVSDKHKL